MDQQSDQAVISSINIVAAGIVVIAVILVGTVMFFGKDVFVPVLLAWILAQMLAPLMRIFSKWRIPYGLCVVLVLALLIFVFYWLGMFISASATSFIRQMPTYQEKLTAMLNDGVRLLSAHIDLSRHTGLDAEISSHINRIIGLVMQGLSNAVGLFTSLITNAMLVMIVLGFMLAGQRHVDKKISNAFNINSASRVNLVLTSISERISNYLLLQTGLSLITGILVWLSCLFLGINSAITWGALAFFLNYIPTIGSIIAAIPPIILALLQFYPNYWPAVAIAVAVLVINQVIGNIAAPKIMGDKLDISPVVLMLSLMFWGWLWGIGGAFLSVIIIAAIKIICEHIPATRFIAIMMSSSGQCSTDVPAVLSTLPAHK